MSILKLKPAFKDYLWGGHRLVEEYGKAFDGPVLAESWELSCHPDGPSVIDNGPFQGKTLQQYIEEAGKEVLGTNCRRFRDFPILTKFIDAKDNLSIQVHPDNRYALKNEGQYGKTEMWYVVDAGEDAFLYYGFKQEISLEEFSRRIEDETLLEVLHAVPVQKGDVLFIESGTIHAIGKNILVAEIQQNSNVTYRVYDYGRVGADGKRRDLHIQKALAVTNRVPIVKSANCYPHIADCDYFTVDKLCLDGHIMKKVEGFVSEASFANILILDGAGEITNQRETLSYQKGDSFFLPAGCGSYQIEGTCDALITTIREKAGQVRIGVSITSSDIEIGLVDAHQNLLTSSSMPMETDRPPLDLIRAIGARCLDLMEEQSVAMEQCVGIGVGVPGTLDRKKGIVCYSNNICWHNVPIADALAKQLPIPIRIANDTDCVALGETVAGASRNYLDVVLVKLGRGVGGGIILNGEIYEGRGIGGSELGHMVIRQGGKPCSCGRKGCLEAYASIPSLKADIADAFGEALTLEAFFALAAKGDAAAQEVLRRYIDILGTGIVNVVNLFRPQLVLLGGELTAYKDFLLEPLREIMKTYCFGGIDGELPQIEAASLGSLAGILGAASLL